MFIRIDKSPWTIVYSDFSCCSLLSGPCPSSGSSHSCSKLCCPWTSHSQPDLLCRYETQQDISICQLFDHLCKRSCHQCTPGLHSRHFKVPHQADSPRKVQLLAPLCSSLNVQDGPSPVPRLLLPPLSHAHCLQPRPPLPLVIMFAPCWKLSVSGWLPVIT